MSEPRSSNGGRFTGIAAVLPRLRLVQPVHIVGVELETHGSNQKSTAAFKSVDRLRLYSHFFQTKTEPPVCVPNVNERSP